VSLQASTNQLTIYPFLDVLGRLGGDRGLKAKKPPKGGPINVFMVPSWAGFGTLQEQVAWRSQGQIPHAIVMFVLKIYYQTLWQKASYFTV